MTDQAPRKISILGSTGSIGRQTLDVIAADRDRFQVCALAANQSIDVLAEQANRFRAPLLSAGTAELAAALRSKLSYAVDRVLHGQAGLLACAIEAGADVVVAATDGMTSLRAVIACVERGTQLALANKELMVAAGHVIGQRARAARAPILPVDSEHSAVFQCLMGERIEMVNSIVLTASGGPFWDWSVEQMQEATPEQALAHPTWVMGAKNTLDSATLMNKGLEVIEASRLFAVTADQLEIVVHRQSIAHAFVIFADGSVKSQLSAPDMRLPIGFALSYPQRNQQPVAVAKTRSGLGLEHERSVLSFEPIDQRRFPALRLAYQALRSGRTFPAVLSAANEEAGRAFLQRKVKFSEICALVERALSAHEPGSDTLESIEEADLWSRRFTREAIFTTAST